MRVVISNSVSLVTHAALLGGLAMWGLEQRDTWQVQVASGRVITVQFSPAVQSNPAPPVTIAETPVETPTPPDEPRVEVNRELAVVEMAELVVEVDVPPSEIAFEPPPMATKSEEPPEEAEKVTPQLVRRKPTADPPERELASIPLEFRTAAVAGVDEPPRLLPLNPSPGYPAAALQANIEGKVVIRVWIAADGSVVGHHTRIERSSGSALLDNEALATVLRWRFVPARKAGRPVEYEVLKPFSFSIRRS